MKLNKMIKYQGTVRLRTGLAIKGSNTNLAIGGVDSEVIKNPLTGMPYIPGSSLKGRMRGLLELKYNKVDRGGPCRCGRRDCMVCTVFGAHFNTRSECSPTRIIVRDCELTKEALELIGDISLDSGSFLEEKSENVIDRNSGRANSPRVMERVPAGLSFGVELVLQIMEGDDEQKLKAFVEEGLALVQASYLGGSGSRGYGQVEITGEWKDALT